MASLYLIKTKRVCHMEDGQELKQGEHLEYSASVLWARNGYGLDLGGNSDHREEWLDLRNVSEGESSHFIDGEERKREIKDPLWFLSC